MPGLSTIHGVKRPGAGLALLLLVACRPEVPAGGRSSPGSPPPVMLLAQNVPLSPGEDAALRIGFQPFTPSVRIIVGIPDRPPGLNVDVCALATPSSPIASSGACLRGIGTGVRETLERPEGLGAVAVVLRGGAGATADVRLEYDEAGRSVSLRIPRMAPYPGDASCKDNACNPFVEVMPVRGGPFRARAAWQGGPATLRLLSGRVLAKAFTATGIPYRVPAEDLGSAPLGIDSRLAAPAEYALAFASQDPSAELTDVLVEATWP